MTVFSSKNRFFKLIHGFVAVTFLLTSLPTGALAVDISGMVAPGALLSLSAPLQGPALIGLQAYPQDPLKFSFILDQGAENLDPDQLSVSFEKAVRYFLAGLAIPEEDLWVNLSPYEQDRIVPDALGQTDTGRDMLKQDYILKQLSASLTYPETEAGKKFWDKIYKKAEEQLGGKEIPKYVFNKVWIVPEHSVVYETGGRAVIGEARLKVMLEADYLAWKNDPAAKEHMANGTDSYEAMREIIVPLLEEEVNSGAYFMPLRQIYHALILSSWFKDRLKMNAVARVYGDKRKIAGIEAVSQDDAVQAVYDQYITSYRKGAYNYIKEDVVEETGEVIARQYFSGGTQFSNLSESRRDEGLTAEQFDRMMKGVVAGRKPVKGDVRLSPVKNPSSTNSAILAESKDPVLGAAAAVTINKDAFDLKNVEIMGRLMGLDYLVQMMDELYDKESRWQWLLDKLSRKKPARKVIRGLITDLDKDYEILRSFSTEDFTFDLFEKFPPESAIGKFYERMKGLPLDSPEKAELQATLREVVQHPAGLGHFSIVLDGEDRDWLKQQPIDGITVYDLLRAIVSNPQTLPDIPGVPEDRVKEILDQQRERFQDTYQLVKETFENSVRPNASEAEKDIMESYLMQLDGAKEAALATEGKLSVNGYMSVFVAYFVDYLKEYSGRDPSKLNDMAKKMMQTLADLQDTSLLLYREGLLLWHWHTSQLRSIIARETRDELKRAQDKTTEYLDAKEKYWLGLPSGSQLRATADIASSFVSKVSDVLKSESMSMTAEQGAKNTTHSYRWIISKAMKETLEMKDVEVQELYRPLLQEIANSIIGSAEINLPSVDKERGVNLFVDNILTPSQYRTLYNHFKGSLRNIITTEGSLVSHYVFLASADGVGVVIAGRDKADVLKEVKDNQEVVVSLDGQGKTLVDLADPAASVAAEARAEDVISKANMAKVYARDPGAYVVANADTEKEAGKADGNFARGLGLVRTENQLEDADIPSRALYREKWLGMARALKGKPLTIRAFDWKEDKKTTMLFHVNFTGPKMYLDDKMGREIVKEQMRALIDLRNQGYENIRFMFPMVETVDDIKAIKAMIAEVMQETEFADLKGKFPIERGIMIETSKALTNLDDFLKEEKVAFFSIGTNDLTSELYRVNRSASNANQYFDDVLPGIVREVVSVIQKASVGERKVTICGELASKQRFWIIRSMLRDMDIHFGLSMPSNDIPVFNGVMESLKKKAVRDIPEFKALQQHLREILESADERDRLDEKYLNLIGAELRIVNAAIENDLRAEVAKALKLTLPSGNTEDKVNSSVLGPGEAETPSQDRYGGVDFTGYRSTAVVRQDEPIIVQGPLSEGEGIVILGGEGFAGFSFDVLTIVPYVP